MEDFQEKTDAILEHMANSTVDTSTISTLTTQNETLQSQLANATTDLMSMWTLVETLCKEVSDLKKQQPNNSRKCTNRNKNDTSYCWTHGRTRNRLHTSESCRNKAEGHKSEATLENKLGGSERYCGDM